MLLSNRNAHLLPDERHCWPETARDLLEALEQSRPGDDDRRRALRMRCYTRGRLVLLNPDYEGVEWPVYLRDLTSKAAGFITPMRLPADEPGVLHFRTGSRILEIDCQLNRRRELPSGWYEGVLEFHREQDTVILSATPAGMSAGEP